MAIGLSDARESDNTHVRDGTNVNDILRTSTEKRGGYYDPEANNEKGGRKMSRVGGVVSDADSQLSVGKQLELESTNSIKYRTCSWQKVIPYFTIKSSPFSTRQWTGSTDWLDLRLAN